MACLIPPLPLPFLHSSPHPPSQSSPALSPSDLLLLLLFLPLFLLFSPLPSLSLVKHLNSVQLLFLSFPLPSFHPGLQVENLDTAAAAADIDGGNDG